MRIRLTVASSMLSVAVFGLASSTAQADYLFSGTGINGNFSGQASEPYQWNADISPPPTTANWGSPGVSQGETPYLESQNAFGFEISFTGGGAVDAASINLGNASACRGTSSGGTTFCTGTSDIWQAFLVGPDTIQFLAQNASFDVATVRTTSSTSFLMGPRQPGSRACGCLRRNSPGRTGPQRPWQRDNQAGERLEFHGVAEL